MQKPLFQFFNNLKMRLLRINWSFEWVLIAALICITSSVSYTAYLAYQSLVQLTEAVAKGSESELKLLMIKSISGDLAAAESNIKSYGLSKQKAYLNHYQTSLIGVKKGMAKLDSLIPAGSKQQITFDSLTIYVDQKIAYLKEFVQIQERGSVVNELNVLTLQIEQNKKILAYYIGDQATQNKKESEEDKPGFIKRLFNNKSIKKKEAETKSNQQREAVNRLNDQIHAMEKVKKEIGKVKQKQGSTLKNIDEEELVITQKNKVISEHMSSFFVSLEMDELAHTRKVIEDIDRRHQKSDRLISVVSILGAFFLLVLGFVVISFIRKKNVYQKALLVAKNEAEQYAQLQERFLANMSHEIRTPMNAISGFTDQLLKTTLKEQQRTHLGIVKQATQYLLVIINDILDYAKLKADKLTIESISFSLHETIKDTVKMMADVANEKGVELIVKMQEHAPQTVTSDPVRLRQILLNVLGNALKFTQQGSVTINVMVNEKVTIQVKDTGIGISKQNLARIFNAFEQAEISTARKYGGSGLGLSITQKLVSLLNGNIDIQSELEKGTTVTMVFDWSNADTAKKPSADKTLDETEWKLLLAGKHILMADDEEWNTVLVSSILDDLGVRLTIVKNGLDAVKEVNQQPFDLVLMDVRMPVMDGFEAAKRIRQSSKVPIVGLTADVTEGQVKNCYAAGMNAILSKPFSETELCETIYNALTFGEKKTTKPEPKQKQVAARGQLYSIAVLEEMSKGDSSFTIHMLQVFIRNGGEAMNKIMAAHASKDWQVIADCAHKMLPSVRQLEADTLLALLKSIEQKCKQQSYDGLLDLIKQANDEFGRIADAMQKKIEQLKK